MLVCNVTLVLPYIYTAITGRRWRSQPICQPNTLLGTPLCHLAAAALVRLMPARARGTPLTTPVTPHWQKKHCLQFQGTTVTFPWSISRDSLNVSHFLLVIVAILPRFLDNPIFIAILVGPDGCFFEESKRKNKEKHWDECARRRQCSIHRRRRAAFARASLEPCVRKVDARGPS